MRTLLEFLPLLIWAGLWISGGWLLTAALFRLRSDETALAGTGIGMLAQAWLTNIIGHWIPIAAASWISVGVLFAAGLIAYLRSGRPKLRILSTWPDWAVLAALTMLFVMIGRGLGIFDDYQNLPTISLMATGDVPPRFALNPSLNFGYHYFLLLFAAQIMRLGSMFPWTALDVARGLVLALPLILAGLWTYRMVHNRVAAVLAGMMLALAGGGRWLLLLLPPSLLQWVSDNVRMIGSASTSAPNMASAMLGNWKIDGAGPIPFPFAFYTGINQPYVMAYTGIAGSGILVLLLLLLIGTRRRYGLSAVVIVILLAVLALANEIALLLIGFGLAVVALMWAIARRSLRLPRELLTWIGLYAAALVVALLQGGLLTEIVRSRLLPRGAQAGYFDTSLSVVWPPAIISAHLGSLSLLNPAQLIAALAEIGPLILMTPLLIAWFSKAFRAGRWYEAALIASSAATVLALFMAFKGPLYTAWPRLLSGWFLACVLFAVPLLWVWLKRHDKWQPLVLGWGFATCLAGLVLLGVQLLAIQKPVLATFITPLDARMSKEYWNKLEPEALVFDPVVYRAPTVFGRFTDSSPSWYTKNADWQVLAASPNPQAIRAAGFAYMYFDKDYWDGLTPALQQALSGSCVKQVAQVDGIHSEQNYAKDFRRLLDIKGCK